jgi:hypothetical protein
MNETTAALRAFLKALLAGQKAFLEVWRAYQNRPLPGADVDHPGQPPAFRQRAETEASPPPNPEHRRDARPKPPD